MAKKVAVLGGGAVAQTMAAELSLLGYSVHLYDLPEVAKRYLGEVLERRRIELGGLQMNFRWIRREGVAEIELVTTDVGEAVRGVERVLVAIPATYQERLFERLIPHLEDGQVIAIFPDNFGSLILRWMMRERGCEANVVVGGFSSTPYGTRLEAPGRVNCVLRIAHLVYDALPSRDVDRFHAAVGELPIFDGTPRVERGDTVVGVGLSNPNPVVHVPGSILSVGPMEVSELEGIFGIPKGKWSMYKYGLSPAVSRVQYAFHLEERRIAGALGVGMVEHPEEHFFWKMSVMGMEYWAPFVDVIALPIEGPTSVEHRYFTEDIGVGCSVRYQLARKLGVEVPIIEAMMRIGSVVCKRDFFREGRSLRELGLEDLRREQILGYLRKGSA